MEVADPAVVGVRLALEQAALLELVDDRDHPAGGDVEPLRERVLWLAVAGRHGAEQCELARLEPERPQHAVEPARDRVAEAREHEPDTPKRRRFRFARFGFACGHADMIQLVNDSATERFVTEPT